MKHQDTGVIKLKAQDAKTIIVMPIILCTSTNSNASPYINTYISETRRETRGRDWQIRHCRNQHANESSETGITAEFGKTSDPHRPDACAGDYRTEHSIIANISYKTSQPVKAAQGSQKDTQIRKFHNN